jgi:hypothetical protein
MATLHDGQSPHDGESMHDGESVAVLVHAAVRGAS